VNIAQYPITEYQYRSNPTSDSTTSIRTTTTTTTTTCTCELSASALDVLAVLAGFVAAASPAPSYQQM